MASRAPTNPHSSVRRNLFPSSSTSQPSQRPSSRSSNNPQITASHATAAGLASSQFARRNPSAFQLGPERRAGNDHVRPAANRSGSSADTIPVAATDAKDESGEGYGDDILVRDPDGGIKGLEMPWGHPVDRDQGREDEDGDDEMDERSKASIRLIELHKSHSRQHIDPAELRAAVQASLREKLASLDGDKWMYEEEDETAAQA